MANETKLAWFELEASMFPKNVQEALAKAVQARKVAGEATKAADELLQTFAGRIQVPTSAGMAPLLGVGFPNMVISHRFGKLSVAATTETKTTTKKEKQASLA